MWSRSATGGVSVNMKDKAYATVSRSVLVFVVVI